MYVYDSVMEGQMMGSTWVGLCRQVNGDGSAELKAFDENGLPHGTHTFYDEVAMVQDVQMYQNGVRMNK